MDPLGQSHYLIYNSSKRQKTIERNLSEDFAKNKIPRRALHCLFSQLNQADNRNAALTCKRWREISLTPEYNFPEGFDLAPEILQAIFSHLSPKDLFLKLDWCAGSGKC